MRQSEEQISWQRQVVKDEYMEQEKKYELQDSALNPATPVMQEVRQECTNGMGS